MNYKLLLLFLISLLPLQIRAQETVIEQLKAWERTYHNLHGVSSNPKKILQNETLKILYQTLSQAFNCVKKTRNLTSEDIAKTKKALVTALKNPAELINTKPCYIQNTHEIIEHINRQLNTSSTNNETPLTWCIKMDLPDSVSFILNPLFTSTSFKSKTLYRTLAILAIKENKQALHLIDNYIKARGRSLIDDNLITCLREPQAYDNTGQNIKKNMALIALRILSQADPKQTLTTIKSDYPQTDPKASLMSYLQGKSSNFSVASQLYNLPENHDLTTIKEAHKIITQHLFNPKAMNDRHNNKTALDWAIDHNYPKLVQLLLNPLGATDVKLLDTKSIPQKIVQYFEKFTYRKTLLQERKRSNSK